MISLFDLLKIGIGPSSSHTVGPMIATQRFVKELDQTGEAESVARIVIDLYGSLALTGKGHRTDRAAVLGLCGEHPRSVDPESIDTCFAKIQSERVLLWLGKHSIDFDIERDLLFHGDTFLPEHPNGIRCTAMTGSGETILEKTYLSVGGGFVVGDDEIADAANPLSRDRDAPFSFCSAAELLSQCAEHKLTISELVQQNELTFRSAEEIDRQLDQIWDAMNHSIEMGCQHEGILPGGLNIRRRAPGIFKKLSGISPVEGQLELPKGGIDPLVHIDWVTLFALAVNEENAAGGRVVTAPTNGAAGVIPAVLAFFARFDPSVDRQAIYTFLRTASAIGMLYKRNASLSAAEMGCQGEVGVACSMAAAGLAAVMGGTPAQIENAAEIGMEHNLGLTCDPVAGLVQVPCIERNAMGAVKAINAARLAVLYGNGEHCVSLDKVIETMRQTGVDMQSKYKETSLGGLAVNVINC
ncbi:L-serine ammonia-lyase [Novipirellula sp. SH528]|uniref:L-serine ammonia-lyase n=1 Tax=Novipirellula sp. SH528 TaxID=3454466 RepID=UPI003F9F7E26